MHGRKELARATSGNFVSNCLGCHTALDLAGSQLAGTAAPPPSPALMQVSAFKLLTLCHHPTPYPLSCCILSSLSSILQVKPWCPWRVMPASAA